MKSYLLPILALLFFGVVNNAFGQACPACSNPALQSSEKLESGLDTLKPGYMRFTINATNGFNYQGGHPNYKGLSANGEIIPVPLHNHVVSLDFLRTELCFEYTFLTNWSVWLRVPYDIKSQTASIEYPVDVSETEKEAILRNRDIHHRNETYTGISDLRLMVAHRINGFLSENGRLDIAFGSSVPVGKTENDPLTAGKEGHKHMHIQFGTGTFDPLLELHYATPISDQFSLALFTINKISLYENHHQYKGPFETTSGVSFGYRPNEWLIPRVTFANFSQTQAQWSGVDDPNSGLISFNVSGNITFKLKNGLAITPGYRHPISQKTLSDEGDAFKYGPTFLLNVSYLLRNDK